MVPKWPKDGPQIVPRGSKMPSQNDQEPHRSGVVVRSHCARQVISRAFAVCWPIMSQRLPICSYPEVVISSDRFLSRRVARKRCRQSSLEFLSVKHPNIAFLVRPLAPEVGRRMILLEVVLLEKIHSPLGRWFFFRPVNPPA